MLYSIKRILNIHIKCGFVHIDTIKSRYICNIIILCILVMKKSVILLVFLSQTILFANHISATTYYVSPSGTSSATGTISNPYSFTTAIAKSLTAGDSIIVRGGMYSFSSTQSCSKSGSAVSFLHIVNYPGEIPVFDFRNQAYSSSNQGFKISGNYVHVKGLIIQGAGDNGMQVTGSNNKIENCAFRWNCDSGLQMKTGSNNLILNCDSYENFDYMSGGTTSPDYGGNADGFADKQYTNAGTNTYRGCRSWKNSDDGWDSYEKIGNTVYDNCWCYANGPASFDMTDHIRFKKDSAAWFSKFKDASNRYVVKNYGNGNGFKVGGNYTANNATLTNCVSVGNTVKGFDQNNNNGIMTLYNCTGYDNKPDYGFSNSGYGTLVIKNCATLNSRSSNSFRTKTVTQEYNSWNSGFACVSADFLSLESIQLINERQADGSLPEITLLHQTSTSGMIDKGTNVGLAFAGSAPDLGAFEYGVFTTVDNVRENEVIWVNYNTINKEIAILAETAEVDIYQLNGAKVYSLRKYSDQTIIPANEFGKGVYLIRAILKNGNMATKKILIN